MNVVISLWATCEARMRAAEDARGGIEVSDESQECLSEDFMRTPGLMLDHRRFRPRVSRGADRGRECTERGCVASYVREVAATRRLQVAVDTVTKIVCP